MRWTTQAAVALAVGISCFVWPVKSAAQTTGIAGQVRDISGAVLPGVTVEAASPALIEKVLTATTDGQGLYRVIDLRPGIYTVTFKLPGFATVVREGIELTAAFTATVDAQLRVGAIEETVTVAGTAPTVDVHNVVQQRVINRETLDALPSARNFASFAQAIPGVVPISVNRTSGQDVGGLSGERAKLVVHGSRTDDFVPLLDGVHSGVTGGAGANQGYTANPAEIEEFSYVLGGNPAEFGYGGPVLNQIPKSGGNLTTGFFFGNFSTTGLSSSNLDADLMARGLTSVNRVKRLFDINPAMGGPLARDRLWYFTSYRYSVSDQYIAGMYYSVDPTSPIRVEDKTRPAVEDTAAHSVSGRLTWQATTKNQFSGYVAWQPACNCHYNISGLRASPEATIHRTNNINTWWQGTWKAPITNKLLLQASVLGHWYKAVFDPQAETTAAAPGIIDSSGLIYRAANTYLNPYNKGYNSKASLTYITGSHALKFGFELARGTLDSLTNVVGDVTYSTINFVPNQVTIYNSPRYDIERLNALLGTYVQDQWTFKRLTLNGGVRFERLDASIPAAGSPAGQFVPARQYPAFDGIPTWNDLTPRIGVAFDVFGNGKTALKMSAGQYLIQERLRIATAMNPATASGSASRSWMDNGNFVPDCDLRNFAANGECGPLQNSAFGSPVLVTRYDDSVRTGWGVRPYNWEFSAGVQHELLPRISSNVTYSRRSYSNFFVTDNLNWTPADFSPYCIVAPVDSRLPGGGGNQLCGFYDIDPAKLPLVNNVITSASTFGKQTETFNGVDVTTNIRLPHGAFVSGGISTGTFGLLGNVGQNSFNRCFTVDSPRQGYDSSTPQAEGSFCGVAIPWQTQVRFVGSTRLPWGFQASGTFMTNPPPQITATYTISNAQALGLGRNLAAGRATIELVQPGTLFGDRLYQVDGRIARVFRLQGMRVNGMVDIFNMFNANPVLAINTSYSPTAWQRPTYVLPGRFIKFGMQIDL